MSKKKKGLGKGLSALFGDQEKSAPTKDISLTPIKASISNLNRNNYQPRINFDEAKLDELASSINPAPKNLEIDDVLAPPIAPADIICISVKNGKTKAKLAKA